MPYELELRLTTASRKDVDVFVFWNIRSTGYFLSMNSFGGVDFKNAEYAELDSVLCFDDENQPYTPTPADESIWSDLINEAIKTQFKKVA